METNLILWAIVVSTVFIILVVTIIILVVRLSQLKGKTVDQRFDRMEERFSNEMLKSKIADLTPRERDVLELMKQHLTAKEIGNKLNTEESTVKKQTSSAYRKLGINKKSEALEILHSLERLTQ